MFRECSSLISLNLGNFNTTKVTVMDNMFNGCSLLTSLNLSSFASPSLVMDYMFNGCINLEYINMLQFTNNINEIPSLGLIGYKDMFYNIPDNIVVCINTNNDIIINELNKTKCYNIDCSDDWKSNQKKKIEVINDCVKNCINIIENEYKIKCYENCTNKYFQNNSICQCNLDKCLLCPPNGFYKELCSICNINYYPKENDELNIGEYFNCYKELEGYYLDKTEYLYKKCYETCEKCEKRGNNTNHNCLKCNSKYTFEINFDNYINCYKNCSYYYYFDKFGMYHCTDNFSCPDYYNLFIPDKNKCIHDCEKDDIYIYEYDNKCYKKQKEMTIICDQDNPFENLKKHKCVKNCDFNEMLQKICILKYVTNETKTNEKKEKEEEIKVQDKILETIEEGFTSDNYDTTNLEKGKDEIIETDKMKITLTTTDNQKNNTNTNMTTIDLGECELLLRKFYNISDDERLYMKKIDVFLDGMKIPKIEYEVYCKLKGTNLEKLNKSVCENTKISLNIPIVITESLDKLNSSSAYYTDVCYATTSDDGTDISLKDRKDEFIKGNKTICQDDCDFAYYDYDSQKAKCSCKVKESSVSFGNITINKDKLFQNFINFKNIANIHLLKCYKTLFSKSGLIKNIGFYLIILIIIFHLISMILFYLKYWDIIKHKINDIVFLIKNFNSHKKVQKENKDLINNDNKKKNSKIIRLNKTKKKSFIGIKDKKKKTERINFVSHEGLNNNIIIDKNIDNKGKIKDKKGNRKKSYKKKSISKISKINKIGIEKNFSIKENSKEKITKKLKIDSSNQKKDIIFQNKENFIIKNNDEQINNLSYNLAIIYDKRSYCQYYFSLIKTKQLIVFSFFYNNDYNSKIIKIDLFFISFIVYYTVNALFYNDETMHKLYESKGSFDLEYKLPKIFYSSLISIVLNAPLKLLALSNNNLLELKDDKLKKKIKNKSKRLINKLIIKFILYFIISLIFLLLFWYYLSMFCAIYRNTQYHLIKDTLISFGFSLLYPFGINLLPGIFRIPALSNPKKKRILLYKFSKVLQFF